eukprot:3505090-Rhodomonas_salina.1
MQKKNGYGSQCPKKKQCNHKQQQLLSGSCHHTASVTISACDVPAMMTAAQLKPMSAFRKIMTSTTRSGACCSARPLLAFWP